MNEEILLVAPPVGNYEHKSTRVKISKHVQQIASELSFQRNPPHMSEKYRCFLPPMASLSINYKKGVDMKLEYRIERILDSCVL